MLQEGLMHGVQHTAQVLVSILLATQAEPEGDGGVTVGEQESTQGRSTGSSLVNVAVSFSRMTMNGGALAANACSCTRPLEMLQLKI